MREWLVAADDRTGAFEVAALFAAVAGPVTVSVGEAPGSSSVVDVGTRAMSADDAARVAAAIDSEPSTWVAHKIDSTLRGNWVVELRARQRATGRRVVVLPGWPDMGRTCVRGVVYVNGHPIGDTREHLAADLIAGADELSAWLTGTGATAVCDVPDSQAMHDAAKLLSEHDVLVAGPAGPLGAVFAARNAWHAAPTVCSVIWPVLVVCGSANPIAREQIRRLQVARPDVGVCATVIPDGDLHAAAVAALATQAHTSIAELQPRTIIIIGGDTAAELLGSRPRLVSGLAAPGMPFTVENGPLIITKAGGFGGPDALVDLVGGENG